MNTYRIELHARTGENVFEIVKAEDMDTAAEKVRFWHKDFNDCGFTGQLVEELSQAEKVSLRIAKEAGAAAGKFLRDKEALIIKTYGEVKK